MVSFKLPSFAGVRLAPNADIIVTGKASAAMANGDVVESIDDGLTWTKADTPTLSDTVQDVSLKGVVVFDPVKGTTAFAVDDRVSVCIWGIITCKAIGTAGIDEFELLQAGTAGDAGRVRVSTYASIGTVTHDHIVRVLQSHVGLAMNAQNGAADTLVWVFVGMRA